MDQSFYSAVRDPQLNPRVTMAVHYFSLTNPLFVIYQPAQSSWAVVGFTLARDPVLHKAEDALAMKQVDWADPRSSIPFDQQSLSQSSVLSKGRVSKIHWLWKRTEDKPNLS